MRPVGDADLLRFLIEQRGVTQAGVAAGAGIAESTISEVLAGKRTLNRRQIAKLARYFHVEPGAFLAEC
jgi:HTH-type transcriptional regulator / antitoxin HigA